MYFKTVVAQNVFCNSGALPDSVSQTERVVPDRRGHFPGREGPTKNTTGEIVGNVKANIS